MSQVRKLGRLPRSPTVMRLPPLVCFACCLLCGAELALSPENSSSACGTHAGWHKARTREPSRGSGDRDDCAGHLSLSLTIFFGRGRRISTQRIHDKDNSRVSVPRCLSD